MEEKSQNCSTSASEETFSEKPSVPGPQRRLRLNRRGFHLSNVLDTVKVAEKKSLRKIDLLSEATDLTNSIPGMENSEETPMLSDKKTIVLSNSTKNGFKSKTDRNLSDDKNSCNASDSSGTLRSVYVGKKNVTVNVENVNSQDVPPKKKHKPITWP